MIKEQNGDFTKIEMYNMMKGNDVKRASDLVDVVLEIRGFIVCENISADGSTSVRLIARTDSGYMGTNSNFLMNDIKEISELVGSGNPFSVAVKQGRSKAGRNFLYAEWVQ